MHLHTDTLWSENEIRELIEFAQYLREENENLRAMIIASDEMIKNKEAQIKKLKEDLLWKSLI